MLAILTRSRHTRLAILLIPAVITHPLLIAGFGAITVTMGTVLLFISFAEELLFRGLLQRSLEWALGARKGLALTAVLFSLWHVPADVLVSNYSPAGVFIRVTLDLPVVLVFGYIAYRSDNLVGSTIFHAIYNFTLVASILS